MTIALSFRFSRVTLVIYWSSQDTLLEHMPKDARTFAPDLRRYVLMVYMRAMIETIKATIELIAEIAVSMAIVSPILKS